MSEQQAPPRGWTGVRVSLAVKRRLERLAEERTEDMGRRVTVNEVIEVLLADQWGRGIHES